MRGCVSQARGPLPGGSSDPWCSAAGLPAGVDAGASVGPLSSEQGPLVPSPGTAAAQPVYLKTAGLYLWRVFMGSKVWPPHPWAVEGCLPPTQFSTPWLGTVGPWGVSGRGPLRPCETQSVKKGAASSLEKRTYKTKMLKELKRITLLWGSRRGGWRLVRGELIWEALH